MLFMIIYTSEFLYSVLTTLGYSVLICGISEEGF